MSFKYFTALSLSLALATVFLNGAAQLLLRGAATRGADPTQPLTLLKSPMFITALFAYGASVLTWTAVLRKVPLTVATPFVALAYVVVPVAAKLIFDDELAPRMVLGMLLVVVGVVVVAAQ